jgi:hypothetical protein
MKPSTVSFASEDAKDCSISHYPSGNKIRRSRTGFGASIIPPPIVELICLESILIISLTYFQIFQMAVSQVVSL